MGQWSGDGGPEPEREQGQGHWSLNSSAGTVKPHPL